MRTKLLPMLLLLLFVLAACGSNQSQKQTSSQTVAKSATCKSTIQVGQTSSSAASTGQVAPRHMQMGPHMRMTSYRPVTPADIARIEAIVQNAHVCFDKYKDYHLALKDGYRIFAPTVPQSIYHFANVQNFSEAQTTLNLAHPSALLYTKSGDGYQFAGVMYSAPTNATEDQLNARIPLSVAPWHLHVSICLPAVRAWPTGSQSKSLFCLPRPPTTAC